MKNFFFVLFFITCEVFTQTISGVSGVFVTPSAFLKEDGVVSIGSSLLNRNKVEYYGRQSNLFSIFTSITYLPNLELTLRLSKLTDYKGTTQTADRTINIKYNFVNETKFIPAVTVGLHNLTRIVDSGSHLNATYIVFGKHFLVSNRFLIEMNGGYAFKTKSVGDYELLGILGNIQFSYANYIFLFCEQEYKRTHSGVKLILMDTFSVTIGFIDNQHLSVMTGISFNLF